MEAISSGPSLQRSLVVVLRGMLVGGSLSVVAALLPFIAHASEARPQSCIGGHIWVFCDTVMCISMVRHKTSRLGGLAHALFVSLETPAECSRVLELNQRPDDPRKPIFIVRWLLVNGISLVLVYCILRLEWMLVSLGCVKGREDEL